MKKGPIIVEQVINAPLERVWKAITDREEMRHWYFDVSRFWPELGCDFQFYSYQSGKKYVHLCRITDVIEKRKLAYTWRFEGYEGMSEVIFELIPADGQTILKLTHKGIESFPDTDKNFSWEHFQAGWQSMIKRSLKDFAEREKINKSIKVNADPEAIWMVLTETRFVNEWMNTAGKGITAVSDWQEGSEVIWSDQNDNTIARGIVTVNHPESYLKIAFPCYDEESCSLNLGEDYQIYMLTSVSLDQTILEIESDTFSEQTLILSSFWEAALKKIKNLSEKVAKEMLSISVLYY